MSAITELDVLKQDLPSLFDDKRVDNDWDEEFAIVPISDPESISIDPEYYTGTSERFIDTQLAQSTKYWDKDEVRETEYEDFNEPLYDQDDLRNQLEDSIIYEVFGNQTHAGGLVKPNPNYPTIPVDSLAFYLPFHYFLPKWWGVYILAQGVELFALTLLFKCRVRRTFLSFKQAKSIARFYLYHHEAFHHKTECFATRLEASHRIPLFKNGFEKFYRNTVMTPNCLEESLAEATALIKVKDKLKQDSRVGVIMDALYEMCRKSPPGYAEGVKMIGSKFNPNRNKFSEKNIQICFPGAPRVSNSTWTVSNYMFQGISNVKSQVNYIVPKNSPISKRISGIRLRMSPREVKKKLNKLVSGGISKMNDRRGRHPMYETGLGARIPIPEHPRDIKIGTIKSIISLAGLSMTVREFQNA